MRDPGEVLLAVRVGEGYRLGQVWGNGLPLEPRNLFLCCLPWRGIFLGRKQPHQSAAMGG